jgi:hypothetical protein
LKVEGVKKLPQVLEKLRHMIPFRVRGNLTLPVAEEIHRHDLMSLGQPGQQVFPPSAGRTSEPVDQKERLPLAPNLCVEAKVVPHGHQHGLPLLLVEIVHIDPGQLDQKLPDSSR